MEHLTCLILRTSLGPCLVDGLFRNPSIYCLVYYTLHVYYNGYMYGHIIYWNVCHIIMPFTHALQCYLNKCYNLSLIVTGAGYFHLHSYYTQSTSFSQMDGLDRLLLGFFGVSCLLLLISGIVYVICLTCHSVGLLPPRFSNKVNL